MPASQLYKGCCLNVFVLLVSDKYQSKIENVHHAIHGRSTRHLNLTNFGGKIPSQQYFITSYFTTYQSYGREGQIFDNKVGWPTIIKQVLLIFEISNPNRYCGL